MPDAEQGGGSECIEKVDCKLVRAMTEWVEVPPLDEVDSVDRGGSAWERGSHGVATALTLSSGGSFWRSWGWGDKAVKVSSSGRMMTIGSLKGVRRTGSGRRG